MKLFLFGWAETHDGHSNVDPLLKLIEQTIKGIDPKQIFHIPFARTIATEPERDGDWFHKHIHLRWVEYLNAANEGDIEKVNSPLVFISGGGKTANLLEKIKTDSKLEQLIRNANHIIGESSGSMVLWEQVRIRGQDGKDILVKWLWIIKDTVLEPHYREKNRQALLEEEMKETHMKYGIGIDVETAMVFDMENFPEKYEVIGNGIVEVKNQ